jgi:hypothetical protein
MREGSTNRIRKLPVWGWMGFCLICIFWPINWFFQGSRTIWAFFPLWTGFSLAIDGIVCKISGSSLISRSKKGFVSLFFISAPSWWLFEILNQRVQNWHYLGIEKFTPIEFIVLSTINFSTVVPAIFEASELLYKTRLFNKLKINLKVSTSRNTTIGFFVAGLVMLSLLMVWPKYFFPFMWISIYCILEPVNIWMGNASLAEFTDKMNWKPVFYLFAGALMTGFFWEFWNYFSYPKWTYTIPYVVFGKIFEMTFLGYFGYLPFSLEMFVIFQIANKFLKIQNAGLIPVFGQNRND